jgi:hypothetical protein
MDKVLDNRAVMLDVALAVRILRASLLRGS